MGTAYYCIFPRLIFDKSKGKSGERLCAWRNTTKEAPRLAQTPHSESHKTNIDALQLEHMLITAMLLGRIIVGNWGHLDALHLKPDSKVYIHSYLRSCSKKKKESKKEGIAERRKFKSRFKDTRQS
jgi:hypothetical protein